MCYRLVFQSILIGVFLNLSQSSFSQVSIETGFQRSEVWNSLGCQITKTSGRNSIGLNIVYGFDALMIFDQNRVFKRRFYGRNLAEQLSYGIEYMYNLAPNTKGWHPSFFYKFAYSYAPIRNVAMFPSGTLPDGNVYYLPKERLLNRTRAFENYLGIRFDLELINNFSYFQKIGMGYAIYSGLDQTLGGGIDGDIGFIFSCGMKYSFMKE